MPVSILADSDAIMTVPGDTKPLPPLTPLPRLSPDRAIAGDLIPPIQKVRLFSSDDWEDFTAEWAHCLSEYAEVRRVGGANDRGLDVVGYTVAPPGAGPWDNYQCKHYNHGLYPKEIWLELGKLAYYTFTKAYDPPRAYYFVAPHDCGSALSTFLQKPEVLRAELIAKWSKHCKKGITSKKEIKLEGKLLEHVERFDFSIVKTKPILKILEQYRASPHYMHRFGGGLPDRQPVPPPPVAIAAGEARYVEQLLEAYSDCLGRDVHSRGDISPDTKLEGHFDRSREQFYFAEALRVFSRESLPPGAFEALQGDVHDGVIDVAEASHPDGFVRVCETTKAARNLQLPDHALSLRTNTRDRSGICHQLANDDRLHWVPNS